MGFRNQSQGGSTGISMSVGPSLTTGMQNAFPVDVLPYGGALGETLAITDGSSHTILGAPAAGKVYRLHRLVAVNLQAGPQGILQGGSGVIYSNLSSTSPNDNLLGQLVSDPEGLLVQILNYVSGAIFVSLTYDVVLIPTIT